MFIKVYRLERRSVMLVFSTQLCELLPLSPFLFQPPPPTTFPVWISILNKHILYVGVYGVLGLRQINTCRKVPLIFLINIFRWKQFALPSVSLIFLRLAASNYRVLLRCKIHISSANNFRSGLRTLRLKTDQLHSIFCSLPPQVFLSSTVKIPKILIF